MLATTRPREVTHLAFAAGAPAKLSGEADRGAASTAASATNVGGALVATAAAIAAAASSRMVRR